MTIEEARDLYKRYACNLFKLSRSDDAGLENSYRMLNIPRSQELIWEEEYILEKCEIIKNQTLQNSYQYIYLYKNIIEILDDLIDTKNIYFICNQIIDTLEYATNNQKSYHRVHIGHTLCNKIYKDSHIFINIVAKANNNRSEDDINLIDKLNTCFHRLLDMNLGNNIDEYHKEDKEGVLHQFELQYNDILQGRDADVHEYKLIWTLYCV